MTKPAIVTSDTILAHLSTVLKTQYEVWGILSKEVQRISTHHPKRTLLLNASKLVWFTDCWLKTNCTPMYHWIHQLNSIINQT